MKTLLVFFSFVFLSCNCFSQKSYEESDRAIFHYWYNKQFYKVVVIVDSTDPDRALLEITDEKRNKRLYHKNIVMQTTLEFVEYVEKNGQKVLILKTGALSELRHKIFFGKKIIVKSYYYYYRDHNPWEVE